MKNILLTGSTGFIGTSFKKKFKKKKNLFFLEKYNSNSNKKISLSDKDKFIKFIKKNKIDTVVHLAWHGIPNFNKKNFNINLEITKKLVQYSNLTNIKKIFISGSCFEYGRVSGEISENDKLKFKKNTLGEYKNKIRKYFIQNSNKKIFWGRVFYAFGPYQRSRSLIPSAIKCLKKNKSFNLKKPFDARDYIHVDDVSSAIISIVKKGRPGIYNIGSGIPVLNYNIVDKIYSNFDKKLNFKNFFSQNLKVDSFWSNSKKLMKLGWKPKNSVLFSLKNF